MKTLVNIIILLSLLLLNSCVIISDNITRNYTPFSNEVLNPVKNPSIQLFFDGEPIKFEYKKIGLVETTGNKTSTDIDLFNQLKYLAYQSGADAIISIKQDFVNKQDPNSMNKYKMYYSAKHYVGIAVKKISPDIFNEQNIDTTYVQSVPKLDAMQEKNTESNGTASAVLTILLVGVTAALFIAVHH
ncbi:MAG: hypothetical protein JSU07_11440 [Bacteroidetes bacterium]|nr:hypothetical protein [Bacteroidota bacterium]